MKHWRLWLKFVHMDPSQRAAFKLLRRLESYEH
jgi:hypothetical protein